MHSPYVFLPLPIHFNPATSIFLQYGTQSSPLLCSKCSNHLNLPCVTTLATQSSPVFSDFQLSVLYDTRTKCVTQIAIFGNTLHLHPGFNRNLSQQYGLSRITIQTSPAVEINIFHESTWDVTIPFMNPTRTRPFGKHYKDYILKYICCKLCFIIFRIWKSSVKFTITSLF